MVDEPSSLGEAVMLGAGSIEHRELIHYTVSKSTTFEPPQAGPRRGTGSGVGRAAASAPSAVCRSRRGSRSLALRGSRARGVGVAGARAADSGWRAHRLIEHLNVRFESQR